MLVLTILTVGITAYSIVARMVRTHGLEILILRWLTGTPLHGRHHTNAGWFTRADRILHPSGRPSARRMQNPVRSGEPASVCVMPAMQRCSGKPAQDENFQAVGSDHAGDDRIRGNAYCQNRQN